MKAGIITHYDVHNHGAHLQMYALVQVLESLNYDAKALKFRKNYDFMGGEKVGAKYSVSIKSLPIYFEYLLKNGVARTIYNYKKRKILSDFRTEHELVGEFYSEAKDLDVVVIGSDEIFSIEAGPNPWYYGIGIPCQKQISYAASFGPTTLEVIQKHNVGALIEAGVKHLSDVSVRDKNSHDIVEYFTKREASIVCDPVLLYGFQEEQKDELLLEFKNKNSEKYCIVYSYDYNMCDDETVEAIRQYARKRNLKIYSVAYYHKWCDKNIQVAPLEIFKWFANAEIVFTDTFHGSVISLTTGTQFVAKIKGNANKLSFLLEQYGVAERKVDTFMNIEKVVETPIDYERVNRTIENIRIQSKMFLENALEKTDD